MRIPLNLPLLPSAQDLLPYLEEIDKNRYYTNFGSLNDLFSKRLENWFAERTKKTFHVITCSSATSGLELAISSLKLPPGSKILIPAFTFIATATSVLRMGHVPIAGDCNPESWIMTPEIADAVLGKYKFDAVIPVAAFGVSYKSGEWSSWSKKNGIPVIIDAASAFGSQMPDYGIVTIFSLHATKALCAGEGGLIVTNNSVLASLLKKMTNFGIGTSSNQHYTPGANAKLSEYHSAIGLASLEKFEFNCAQRRRLLKDFISKLDGYTNNQFIYQKGITEVMAPTIFSVLAKNEKHRSAIEHTLAANNIGSRRWYQPLISHSPYLPKIITPIDIPNSIDLEKRLIGLPFYLDLTSSDIDVIVQCISNVN